jgi:hypothetical protein
MLCAGWKGEFLGQTELALSREFHGRAFRESGSPVCPRNLADDEAVRKQVLKLINNFLYSKGYGYTRLNTSPFPVAISLVEPTRRRDRSPKPPPR